MSDAFLLAAARTPIGKFLGGLADLTAPVSRPRTPSVHRRQRSGVVTPYSRDIKGTIGRLSLPPLDACRDLPASARTAWI